MVSKKTETKIAQPSTRCEIRTLGETLIEDRSGILSKLLMPARILIPEEVELCDGIQTVRSCLGLYVWVQMQDRDFMLLFSTFCCIEFGGPGLWPCFVNLGLRFKSVFILENAVNVQVV